MVICAVYGCSNSHRTRNVHFYRFPDATDSRLEAYLAFTARQDKFRVENARICSLHFADDDFERNVLGWLITHKGAPKLKMSAVPTLNGAQTMLMKKDVATASSKRNDHLDRLKRKQLNQAVRTSVIKVEHDPVTETAEDSTSTPSKYMHND
jgi:hypothetical protein